MTQSDRRPNRYRSASFVLSAASLRQLPPSGGEVAFAGRSNAGKSSALNAITDNKSLARTSKTPGRTQLINYFQLEEEHCWLVDLPGYGYAKVPEKMKKDWGELMSQYLHQRQELRGLVLVMDVRHPLKEFDRQMLAWCAEREMPAHVLLTKADKLSRGAASATLQSVRRSFKNEFPGATAQLFSALKGTGLDEARAVLDGWFGFEDAQTQ